MRAGQNRREQINQFISGIVVFCSDDNYVDEL